MVGAQQFFVEASLQRPDVSGVCSGQVLPQAMPTTNGEGGGTAAAAAADVAMIKAV